MYNRWLSSDELYHHGVKGQKWGEKNGPPYPLDRSKSDGHKLLTKPSGSPQGKKRYKTSEKTAHKRAERKARTETKEQDKWKVNKWHMPQTWGDSLHDYLYENNEAYKKNYDEAEPLRKEYSDAVERETAIEQKILNGDFGYTRPDGTNPQALIKAYDEWNKRIKKTQDIYDKLSDHYEKVLKDVNESYDAYKTHEYTKYLSDQKDIDKMKRAQEDGKFDPEFLRTVEKDDWLDDDDIALSEYSKFLRDPEWYMQGGFMDDIEGRKQRRFEYATDWPSRNIDRRKLQKEIFSEYASTPKTERYNELKQKYDKLKYTTNGEGKKINSIIDGMAEEMLKANKLAVTPENIKRMVPFVHFDPSAPPPKKPLSRRISDAVENIALSQSPYERQQREFDRISKMKYEDRVKKLTDSSGKLNDLGRRYYNHFSDDDTLSLKELELRRNDRDAFHDYIVKSSGIDTSSMPRSTPSERKAKADKEASFLSMWYQENYTSREGEVMGALHSRIAKESGSWYNGEAVTRDFQKAYNRERRARKEYREKVDALYKKYGRDVKRMPASDRQKFESEFRRLADTETKDISAARKDLCRVVLNDLGYENTKRNRDLIYDWIIDD